MRLGDYACGDYNYTWFQLQGDNNWYISFEYNPKTKLYLILTVNYGRRFYADADFPIIPSNIKLSNLGLHMIVYYKDILYRIIESTNSGRIVLQAKDGTEIVVNKSTQVVVANQSLWNKNANS